MIISSDAFSILTPSAVKYSLKNPVLDLLGLIETASNSGNLAGVFDAECSSTACAVLARPKDIIAATTIHLADRKKRLMELCAARLIISGFLSCKFQAGFAAALRLAARARRFSSISLNMVLRQAKAPQ
jgi:hypothetical protein